MSKKIFQIITLSGLALVLLVVDSQSLPKCLDMKKECVKKITDCWQPLWEKSDKKRALPECQRQTQVSELSEPCITFYLNECTPSAASNPCGGWDFEKKVCSTFVTGSKAYEQCQSDWDANTIKSPDTLCENAMITMK